MRTRVTAMASASLFATTGLLGAYVGYPGLRRAHAATDCPVTTNADAGTGSLRVCLEQINTAGGGTITFAQPGTITLNADLPPVTQTSSVTITGAGEGQTIISGADLHRAFYFDGTNGDVSFSNLTIQNADLGTTAGPKGGSAIYSSTNVSLSNVTLSNNRNRTDGSSGGALYSAGRVTISGSTLSGNAITGVNQHSGAAVGAGNSVVVTDSVFLGNTTTGRGGAISSRDRDITITGSTFTNNTADSLGGAIYGSFLDSITITDSIFTNNTVNSRGGAIAGFSIDSITITGSAFENNTATNNDGGAIFSFGGDITITGSTFTNNTADSDGGAVYNDGGDITITDGTFTNNIANSRGGAVYNDGGDITIAGSTFTNNTADSKAGAVSSGGSTAIAGSTFKYNSATRAGGAVRSSDGVSITDSTFYGNEAGSGYSGGAVYVTYLGSYGRVDVVNSTFTGNTADAGSALYVYEDDGSGTLRVNFSTVTGNTARTAGGAAIEASDLYALDFVITNSILFGNLDSGSTPLDVETNGNLELAFSLLTTPTSFSAATTTPLPSNLLDGDPLLAELADNGGPTLTMLPAADSPVIGMANPTGAPAFDQRGFTRTTNGLADMGSVERGGTAPEPDLSQMPPAWFQAQQRREQSATCPPGMVPSWAQWPNEGTGGWTCEWTTWWDVHKGSTGGWVTTPGFNPGLRRPE